MNYAPVFENGKNDEKLSLIVKLNDPQFSLARSAR